MTADGSPWSDPDSAAYAGPPPTDRPPPGWPYPAAGYPAPYAPYGYPAPWPARPRRPGQVVAAAVLAFVQGGLVLLSSVYVVFLSSLIGLAVGTDPTAAPEGVPGLATEGLVVGLLQVLSAVLLVVAGVMALNTRRRRALVVSLVAFGVQVALCLYWAVRLTVLADDIPGSDATGAFLAFTLLFLAGPAVGLGLLLLGPGRRWFEPGAAS